MEYGGGLRGQGYGNKTQRAQKLRRGRKKSQKVWFGLVWFGFVFWLLARGLGLAQCGGLALCVAAGKYQLAANPSPNTYSRHSRVGGNLCLHEAVLVDSRLRGNDATSMRGSGAGALDSPDLLLRSYQPESWLATLCSQNIVFLTVWRSNAASIAPLTQHQSRGGNCRSMCATSNRGRPIMAE